MRRALDIPAAWCGDELFQRDDWLVELDADDLGDLDQALRLTCQLPLPQVTPSTFRLGPLADKLRRVQQSLERGGGATLLRGLPMDAYSAAQAERLFWGLTQYLGTPVSQSPAGERLFRVQDEGMGPDDRRARGPNSRRRLSFHTDRCDVIAFLCVRPAASGGDNYVVSSVALYNRMLQERPELVDVLMQPYRYQRHNVDAGNRLDHYEQPIFSIYQGQFAANLLRVLIDRAYAVPGGPVMSALQREALDYVEQLAGDPAMHARFRQQPGDIVLLNNWVTFHRRDEFVDHENPARKRLLLRVWLSVPNSRAVDPRFAASYGATAAGAVRGGMTPLHPTGDFNPQ